MIKPLIELVNVAVSLNGKTILRDITWKLGPGEHWAILGANGSGKSTFLRLVRADLWPAPGVGRRVYAFDGLEQTSAVGVKERIALVSPELQERYLQEFWKLTGLQVILSGFFNTDYVYQRPDVRQKAFAQGIIGRLGVQGLLARDAQELSTGELRKILIARALVGKPRILILDEVCDGLDARSRTDLLQMIEEVARSGTQVLYTTHRSEEILSAVTHVLVLKKGRVIDKFEMACRPAWNHRLPPREQNAAGPAVPAARQQKVARTQPGKILFRLRSATVFLERRKVLREIDWEMGHEQNWVFFGPNGSGKSTLLKLIFGDVHPAVGAKVQRFDLKERASIWDLKKRIGYLSPDFQARYRERLTGGEVIASGFFSSIGLVDKVKRQQWQRVTRLLDVFRLEPLSRKRVLEMSYGEFRKVLLLRALIHNPQVLICDEPFDGLDPASRNEFGAVLDQVSRNGTRLVMVTHHLNDLPACITHGLLLEGGCVICQGNFEMVRHHPATKRLFGLP